MWYNRRRRRAASRTRPRARATREPHNLALNSPMHQVSVERWLEDQNSVPSRAEQYAQQICPICRCSLVSFSNDVLSYPEPAWRLSSLPHRDQIEGPGRRCNDPNQNNHPPADHNNRIVVLNRCGHAFHSSCLASYFENRRYKCPMCQTTYFPAE
ncbi:hypothetical protein ASPWEDRAFT_35973 [Aspergillus wentii DTO 134E9]|uniref:RING-type domain-containing protein n=1 Tax=Aspergillus wentii DTO 134E9 TaxID=1073089 RepID=A0A1L9RTV6_ASPWE|nr:uncharacterized protein ASPWEDRAFT_35973 [Aspergillus wentii DTO 134E9]OJJ38355.1 hypothetical protein ASPWEDRAFT_35973 [Aspergillus wentii DTO 134E9]